MAQRRRRSPSHGSRRQATSLEESPPEFAPLIVIDQTPILKKALAKCRRLRTELHKKQDLLRRFEEEDQPAYQRWISATFGAQLTELREIRERVADWEFIHEQIRCCRIWMPEKLREVHDELMQRLKDGTLQAFEPPPPEDENADRNRSSGDDSGDAEDDFDFDDFVKQAFEEFFDDAEDDEASANSADSTDGANASELRPSRRQPTDPEAAARKSLYRTLAKRLHPDHSELDEGIRERRWNELQTAYEADDLAALQRIEAVCDMEVGGLSLRLGLARLRDLADYHQSHLRPIRQALKAAKRDPAFGFDASKPGFVKREVAAELEDTKQELNHRLALFRVDIEDMLYEFEATFEEENRHPTEEPEAPDDEYNFWADYTAWRDEERRKEAARQKS